MPIGILLFGRNPFNGRNSFSKIDHDTTFMRMKEYHMKNLKH